MMPPPSIPIMMYGVTLTVRETFYHKLMFPYKQTHLPSKIPNPYISLPMTHITPPFDHVILRSNIAYRTQISRELVLINDLP